MLPYRLSFEHPGFLILPARTPAALVPGLSIAWRAGQDPPRSLALDCERSSGPDWCSRLAGVQIVRVSDRMTVMYVLDQSESIPNARSGK